MRQLKLWVYDDCLASAVSGPLDVFATANAVWARQQGNGVTPLFSWRLESVDGQPVRTSSGLPLGVDGALSDAGSDLVWLPGIYCGYGTEHVLRKLAEPRTRALLAALRQQHAAGAVLAANCSASFLLAEAGLLDGRRATTTWWLAQPFAARYPRVQLQADALITDDTRLVCSGATTAYLNLALYLVERVAGAELAATCARLLLIDANRGSQAPYMTMTLQEHLRHGDRVVQRAQDWIAAHVAEAFSLAELAAQVHVSERTLIRRFQQVLGTTPASYVQMLRVEIARNLLETSRLTLPEIALRVGYEDAASFRRLFKRETGLLPAQYRERFQRRGSDRPLPA